MQSFSESYHVFSYFDEKGTIIVLHSIFLKFTNFNKIIRLKPELFGKAKNGTKWLNLTNTL